MPQHGPADRDPEPDSPGNRHIPPKLTMQLPEPRLHGTGETARLGPSKSSRATAHRETGESRHGPPAPPSPSARTNIRGESAAIQPCHCQQAPAERTASSETFHVDGARSYAGQESPTPLTCPGRVSGAEQATCRPDQALAAGSPSPATAWPLEVLAWPLAICGRVIAIHVLIVRVTPDDVPVDQAGLRAATVGMLEGALIPILSQGRAGWAPQWTGSLVPEPGM